MTVESDGRSFDTTSTSFRIMPNTPVYSTVFLKPYTGNATPPASVVNVANLETRVPAEARTGTGRLAEAKHLLTDMLADKTLTTPAQAEAHFRLGAVLNREEHYLEAATELEQAAKLEPNSPAAHLQLGGALMQLKRPVE